jgi:DNA-binding response OmpR family regulator
MERVSMAEKNINKSILIADDNEMNRDLLKKMLEQENYIIYEAENGAEALALIREIDPDVVILDVEMPKINGFQVCKRMMEDEKMKKIPVIFITSEEGFKEESRQVQGLDTGALDYLLRPVSEELLLARVRVGMRLRYAEIELKEKHQELKDKYNEIENMNKFMVGRELYMVELKEKNDQLKLRIKELEAKLESSQ